MTVRAGLKKLSDAGLIAPQAGRGWGVISQVVERRHPVLLLTSHESSGVECMNAASMCLAEKHIATEIVYQQGYQVPAIEEDKQIGGIITFSGKEISPEFAEFVQKRNIPIVAACTAFAEPYDTVSGDNISGMIRLLKDLIGQGYRKIGYLSCNVLEESGDYSFPLRLMAYRQTMGSHGLTPLEHYQDNNNMYDNRDSQALLNWIKKLTAAKKRPEYLIGTVPNQANMALLVLGQNGISAKDDIRITAFANSLDKQLLRMHNMDTLKLLTVPWQEVGKLAADCMMKRLQGDKGPPLSIQIPMKFTDIWD
jgi:DNA-binding LacI/PurR family transcriptional regulator